MIIKLVEIFESIGRSRNSRSTYSLREVYVNPDHVVCLREDVSMKRKLEANLLPENLDLKQQFTKLSLDRGHSGIDLEVVGPPEMIEEKLYSKQLLRG